MGILKTGISAIGKLIIAGILAAAFLVGMIGVVWLGLSGEAVQVPEIVGKDFVESEKELASLGLKIKRRSFRFSQEKPNTVLDQSPRPGDTVKTGLTILVDVAQADPEGSEAPAPVKKDEPENNNATDSTDKTKKTNKNANVGKKPEKTRDVISTKSNKNSNSANTSGSNSATGDKTKNTNSSDNKSDNKTDKKGNDNKSDKPSPTPKPTANPVKTPASAANKQASTGGDVRSRRVPQ